MYRLLFHPLHKFPGDKLAALTGWYREYYDLVKDGDWVEQLQRLHHKYGEFGPAQEIEPHLDAHQALLCGVAPNVRCVIVIGRIMPA